MKQFMDQDFLLTTKTAQHLYHDYAKDLPIIDFHNHLNPAEIAEDKTYKNITEIWLGSDHYKWRAMRSVGISEEYITGDASDYEKFSAWGKTLPYLIGNPLYHWTHLELQRYFDIDIALSVETSDEIWAVANAGTNVREFSARNLIAKQNVKVLCTTDDPVDDLRYHIALQNEPRFKTLPTFRPERAMAIDKPGFAEYVDDLSKAVDLSISNYEEYKKALSARLTFFYNCGCRISDHSLEGIVFCEYNEDEVAGIFEKALSSHGDNGFSKYEVAAFKSAIMVFLAEKYKRFDMVMQLHIGALRNNNSRMFKQVGADAGFDSVDDFSYASQLSKLLDAMDKGGNLPKTVIYNLNSRDTEMIASMIGNFQSADAFGKIQLGAGWWFCDHKSGIEKQLRTLSEYGALGTFIGMVTDSRSFLSFPRHEYFRRILCNYLGDLVEAGEYPNDDKMLQELIERICYKNALEFLQV